MSRRSRFWKRSLRRLGLLRKDRCGACKKHQRSLRLESLEERQLLTVITGSAADDVFRIDLDRGEYRLNHGQWQQLTSAVSFDGRGGTDTVHVVGTSGDETATLGPTGGEIVSGGLRHTFTNVEQVVLRGNGGNDTATLYGSAGPDTAVGRPSSDSGLVSLRDEAGTYLLKLFDFRDVTLNGEGGSDTVELRGATDVANQFEFNAAALHAVMNSGTVTTTADGFETVYATVRGHGGAGGEDTAVLTGTAASETYAGNFVSGELSGSGYVARVAGFDDVTVYSGGGDDRADLVGSGPCPAVSPAADWAEFVQVSDGRHSQRAVGFRLAKATAGMIPDTLEIASIADRTVTEGTETETIPIVGENLSGATLSLVNSNPELVTASLDGTSIVLDFTRNAYGVARIGLRGDRGSSSVFTDFSVTMVDPVTVETVQDAAEGGQTGQFRFTRTDNTGYLTVYFTISGTATNGTDYSQIYTSYNYALGMYVASATFSSGQYTTTVDVSPTDDAAVEGNETVIATLQAYSGCGCCCCGGGGYTVGSPSTATVTIQDNDSSNHAPVLDNSGSMSLSGIDEDPATNGGTLVTDVIASASGDRITDEDQGATEGIAVTAVDNTNGSWQYSTNGGTNWNDFGAPSGSSSRLLAANTNTRVRFVPSSNWNGTVSTGLTFRAWDQTSGSNGGTADTSTNGGSIAFSTATETASIAVSAVNDPPVNTVPGGQSVNEDTGLSLGGTISIADVDDGASAMQVVLSVAHGTLTVSGGSATLTGSGTASVTLDGTKSQINATLAATVTYCGTSNYAGSDTLTVTTSDLGHTGSGGTLTDVDMVTITVNAVNDAPVLDNTGSMSLSAVTKNVATNPGTLVSVVIAHAGGDRITDVDAGAAEGIAVTAVDNANGTWQYSTNGGTNWNDFGSPSGSSSRLLAANADTRVRFVPNTDWYGTVNPGLTFRAWDQTSGSNGGTADTTTSGGSTAFSTATETASIIVRELNHSPVLAAVGNQSGSEHQLLSFTLSATDPDDTPPDNLTFSATGLPSGATLNPITGAFSWTPDWTQHGQHVVTLIVTDDCQAALSDSEEITITIADVDSPPVVENDTANGFPDARESGNVLANDFDPESEALTVTAVDGQAGNLGEWVFGSTGGKFKLIADGSWVFDPDGDFDDLDPGDTQATSITYTAGDGTFTTSGTLTVTVVQLPGTWDNGAANYVETGTGWQTGDGEYGSTSRYHAAGTGGATAKWTYENVPDGVYNVMVTWVPGSSNSAAAPFAVFDGQTEVASFDVNQKLDPLGLEINGVQWHTLGTVSVTSGVLSVQLTETGDGRVVADGLRFTLADAVSSIPVPIPVIEAADWVYSNPYVFLNGSGWTGVSYFDFEINVWPEEDWYSGHVYNWSWKSPGANQSGQFTFVGWLTKVAILWDDLDGPPQDDCAELIYLNVDGSLPDITASEESAVVTDPQGFRDGITVKGRVKVDWDVHHGVPEELYSGLIPFKIGGVPLQPCNACGSNAGGIDGSGTMLNRTADDLETGTGGCASCGGSAGGTGITTNLFDRKYAGQFPQVQPFGTGFGWQTGAATSLMPTADGGLAVVGSDCPVYFDQKGSGWIPARGSTDELRYNPSNETFEWITPDGSTTVFSDLFTSSEDYPRGVLLKTISPSGHVTEVTSFHEGMPETVEETFTEEGTTTALTWQYDFEPVTDWQDLAQSLLLTKTVGSGSPEPLRKATYTYYTDADAYGSLGDLKTVTLQYPDGQGGWIGDEVTYYRYYETDGGTGFERGLKRQVLPSAYEKLAAYMTAQYPGEGKTPLDATEQEIANYTCFYYEYDSAHRVTKETRFGNSEIFTYSYASVETDQDYVPGYNTWEKKNTETRPDGTTYKAYTNFMGQTLLTDLASGSDHWYTFSVYDDAGRLVEAYSSAAVASYVDNGGTSGIDLVVTLNSSAGAVYSYTYYDDSLGTAAEGRLATESIRQGNLGTPVLLNEYEYSHHTDSAGRTVHELAKTLSYESAQDSIDASYSYTYYAGTNAVEERVTTLPVVSIGQNGSGVAATRTEWLDANGRVVWSKDERGAITHYEYDAATGALTRTIEDVDTSLVSDEPAGWTTVTGFGLHIVTDYEHDALGRITQVLGPAHTVDGTDVRTATWTVFKDADHERWTAQGYATESDPGSGDWDTFTLVNPVSLTRFDSDGRVLEEIQALADDTSPGDPQSAPWETIAQETFTQDEYVAWTVHQYSKTKRVATAVYHDIQDASGDSDSDGFTGTAGTHYTVTRVGFDGLGRQVRTLSPDGTATHVFFHAQGLVSETWVGTDDVPSSDYDSSGTIDWKDFQKYVYQYGAAPAGTNMVLVSENVYDGGADGGNGNLTESRAYFGSGTNDYYATNYEYDWRNRLTGALSPADVVTHYDYDNLGQVTWTKTYASSDFTLSSGELRAQTNNLYDPLGRVYESRVYEVDPDDGTVGDYLPNKTWYDARGEVVKTATGNGLFQKFAHDGLGRTVATYTCFDTDETAYSDSDDVTGDTVIEQSQIWYDQAGQVIATATYQRLPDDTSTTGPLSAAYSYATAAVVWYDGMGRTVATADYGREDVDSCLTHYFFDETSGDVIDDDESGLPDVAEGAPPEPFPQDPNSLAGIDFQLQLTEYDAAGRAYRTIDNLGRINETQFDDAGRTIRTIQNYDDGTVEETDTDCDSTVAYEYDSGGRLVTMTAYNAKGSGNGVQSQATKYLYTSATNASWQTAVVYPDSADVFSQDSTTNVWTITTDNGDHVSTEYDRLGRVTSITDQRGVVHEYTFDTAGRLSADTVTDLGGSGIVDDGVLRIGRVYDDIGRLEFVTGYSDTSGTTAVNQVKYEYDGWGNVAREYQEHDGTVDGNTPFVQYDYENGGSGGVAKYVRLDDVVYPDGNRTVDYDYGTAGAIDDIMSRLAIIGDGTDTYAAYKYRGAGRIVAEDYEDIEVKLDYTADNFAALDRFGRVIDQIWTDYGADPDVALDEYTYTYDRAGNRTSRDNELNHDFDETYTYDLGDRLVSAERDNGFDQSWTLDGLGNFSGLDDDGSSQTRTANAANEITAITGGWASPQYDAAGNMISGPKPGSGATRVHYVFDAWNRLVMVKADDSGDPGDTLAEYQYDGSNRRIQKIVTEDGGGPSEAHYFYNQNWQLLEERFVDGQSATIASNQYVWSLRYIDALVVRFHDGNGDGDLLDTGDNIRYYAGDANYNVTATIDANTGGVVERYVYTAYGTATLYSSTWSNPAPPANGSPLYCGYFFDAETGLYQLRNRYYDANLGAFIGRDPLMYIGGPNAYRYVHNYVTSVSDPMGLVECTSDNVGARRGVAGDTVFSPGDNSPDFVNGALDVLFILSAAHDVPIPGVTDIGDLLNKFNPNSPWGIEVAKQIAEMKNFRTLLKLTMGAASVWTKVQCQECRCTNWFTGFPFYRAQTDFDWRDFGKEKWVRCDLSKTAWGEAHKKMPSKFPYINSDVVSWEGLRLDEIANIKQQCADQAGEACDK